MDLAIRKTQEKVLSLLAQQKTSFALTGGTALEIYYLHHRFSVDLDFFSTKYNISEIDSLVSLFKKYFNKEVRLESELTLGEKAQVRFYSMSIKGSQRLLKIDFVEDVLIENPKIEKKEGVPVYSVQDIYLQKIMAISGTREQIDIIGRSFTQGRHAARDVFDLYMLSKKVKPLHQFLQQLPHLWQRGMIHWYQTFSRQEVKLSLLDLDIYDKKFDARKMISYLENEIKKFIKKVIEK